MNQRALAAVLAMPLVAALAVVALFKPLPYTTYAPGPTIDVLGAPDGKEIIQLPDGQKTYRDDGQLRMTTVSVTPKDSDLNLFQVMGGVARPRRRRVPEGGGLPRRQDPRPGPRRGSGADGVLAGHRRRRGPARRWARR